MTQQSSYQVKDWNGQSGERWVANQIRLDAMLAAFGDAAIDAAAAQPDERIIDVGCGAGVTSFALAAKVGAHGHVLGVDISGPLIARARADAPAGLPVAFELADAGSAPLAERRFDLIFSRFGVMFFDDPVVSFAHLRGALKADGRLAFVCWRSAGENDWVRLPMGAVRGIVPPPTAPDPEAPGPFSFGDQGRIERILSAAGFTDIAITPFDRDIPFGQGPNRAAAVDDAVDMAFQVGPLSRLLADQLDAVRAAATDAVRAAFAEKPGERSVIIDGAAWIVTARNRAV